MQIIDITSLSGTAPYDVYICDSTLTYCFLVLSGISTVPQSVELPSFLSGAKNIILKIIDSVGCEFFSLIPCSPPTPSLTVTPSYTPTPTPTPTNPIYPCQCITFDNTGSGENIGYSYLNCVGISVIGEVISGLTFSVCGSQPVSFDIKMSVTTSGECVNNSCPTGQCIAPAELSLIKSVNRIYKACSSTYYPDNYSCITPSVQVNIASIDFNGQAGCNQYNPWTASTAPSGRDFNFKAPGANITSWTQLQIGMRLYPATQSPNSACSNLADLNYWVSRNSLQNRYTPAEGPPIIIRVNNSTITNITDCS
jgi:hypothetical protein